ncbi:hypothetical protein [Bacillus phage SBSphiJ6]|nr:hypothetical protein [Bacillus phage SBSphiJ1]UPI12251.1 hypothetical protein [Bacillus phage SBSphiJ3]UPI12501.1 hypothetical protein [Bacillus phage SBSphiJ4]UPI12996.1 hypothetical protein [Bacillus phage SBSphiJ6]
MPITVDERAKLGGTILDMVDIISRLTNTNLTPAQEAYVLLLADRLQQLSKVVKELEVDSLSSFKESGEELLARIKRLKDELR